MDREVSQSKIEAANVQYSLMSFRQQAISEALILKQQQQTDYDDCDKNQDAAENPRSQPQ
jgi:hypothetical protein